MLTICLLLTPSLYSPQDETSYLLTRDLSPLHTLRQEQRQRQQLEQRLVLVLVPEVSQHRGPLSE